MARRDAWSAGALALLALFALAQAARLDVGSLTRPGPGFFPLVLAATLLVVTAAILVAAWRARAAEDAPAAAADRTVPWKLAAMLGALAVYVAVFERLGFIIATVALLAFLFAALARHRWPLALGAAVLITLAAHLVFDTWLQVRLPPGVLGRW